MAWTAAEQAEIAAADAEIERGWSGASARERALSLWLDRQAAAVGEKEHLARALVGLDIGIGAQGPQHLHGQVLVLAVLGGDAVGMGAPEHLAAGGAAQAGLIRLPAL